MMPTAIRWSMYSIHKERRGNAGNGAPRTEFRFDWNGRSSEKDRTSGNAKKLPNVTVLGRTAIIMVGSPTDKTVYAGWGQFA